MADTSITALLKITGPTKSNLDRVRKSIQNSLNSAVKNITLKVDTKSVGSLNKINEALRSTQQELAKVNNLSKNFRTDMKGVDRTTREAAKSTDKYAKSTKQVVRSSKKMATEVRKAANEMEGLGQSAGLALKRFLSFSLSAGSVFALTAAIAAATREAIDFERELVKVAQVNRIAISGLDNLVSTIDNLSTSLGVSSTELVEASRTLSQAGIRGRELEQALKALAKSDLAPTFQDITSTTEGVVAAFQQFKLEGRDIEEVLGAINAVSGQYAVESADIVGAIKRTGSVFASTSGSIERNKEALFELIGVFTAVRATTRESAESIATGLRTIFTRIQRKSTISLLSELGVELEDADGKFVGILESMRRLDALFKSIDTDDLRFAQLGEELGGFRQINKVTQILTQYKLAQEAVNTAKAGGGSLDADVETAQKSLANQLAKTREEFLKLVRDVTRSDSFKFLATSAISLTRGLIGLADSLKELIPLFGAFAAFRALQGTSSFLKGFSRGFSSTEEINNIGPTALSKIGSESKDQLETSVDTLTSETANNTQGLKELTSALLDAKNSTDVQSQSNSPDAIVAAAERRKKTSRFPSGRSDFNARNFAKDLIRTDQVSGVELRKTFKAYTRLRNNGKTEADARRLARELLEKDRTQNGFDPNAAVDKKQSNRNLYGPSARAARARKKIQSQPGLTATILSDPRAYTPEGGSVSTGTPLFAGKQDLKTISSGLRKMAVSSEDASRIINQYKKDIQNGISKQKALNKVVAGATTASNQRNRFQKGGDFSKIVGDNASRTPVALQKLDDVINNPNFAIAALAVAGAAKSYFGNKSTTGAAIGSGISGGVTGALLGAQAGSSIAPGYGTAVGLVAGGIVGGGTAVVSALKETAEKLADEKLTEALEKVTEKIEGVEKGISTPDEVNQARGEAIRAALEKRDTLISNERFGINEALIRFVDQGLTFDRILGKEGQGDRIRGAADIGLGNIVRTGIESTLQGFDFERIRQGKGFDFSIFEENFKKLAESRDKERGDEFAGVVKFAADDAEKILLEELSKGKSIDEAVKKLDINLFELVELLGNASDQLPAELRKRGITDINSEAAQRVRDELGNIEQLRIVLTGAKLKEQADAAQEAVVFIDLLGIRLKALSEALQQTNFAAQQTQDTFNAVATGTNKVSLRNFDNSILSTAEGTEASIGQLQGLAGNGRVVQDISNVLRASQRIKQVGPDILFGSRLDAELGDTNRSATVIADNLIKQSPFLSGEGTPRAVREAFRASIQEVAKNRKGEGFDTIRELIGNTEDFFKVFENNLSAAGVDAFNTITKSYEGAINEFLSNINTVSQNAINEVVTRSTAQKLGAEREDLITGLRTGGSTTPARTREIFENSIRNLTGGITDPKAIADEITRLEGERIKLLADPMGDLTDKIADNTTKSGLLNKALDELASDVSTLSAVESRLGELRSRRDAGRRLNESIIGAALDPSAARSTLFGIAGAGALLSGTTSGVTKETFGPGLDLIRSILPTLEPEKREAVEKKLDESLSKVAVALGATPEQAEILKGLVDISSEEDRLIGVYKEASDRQIDAINAQAMIQSSQTEYLKKLADTNFEEKLKGIQESLSKIEEKFPADGIKGTGIIKGSANGGIVGGPFAGGKIDNKIIAVQPGEFIMNRRSTRKHRELLEAMNMQGFASGGYIEQRRKINQQYLDRRANGDPQATFLRNLDIAKLEKEFPNRGRIVEPPQIDTKTPAINRVTSGILDSIRSEAASRKFAFGGLPEGIDLADPTSSFGSVDDIKSGFSRIKNKQVERDALKAKRAKADQERKAREQIQKQRSQAAAQAALQREIRLGRTSGSRFEALSRVAGGGEGGLQDVQNFRSPQGQSQLAAQQALLREQRLGNTSGSRYEVLKRRAQGQEAFLGGGGSIVTGVAGRNNAITTGGATAAATGRASAGVDKTTVDTFAKTTGELGKSIKDLDKLSEVTMNLTKVSEQLSKVFIPEKIQVEFAPVQVNVVITGAEALAAIPDAVKDIMNTKIRNEMAKNFDQLTGETKANV